MVQQPEPVVICDYDAAWPLEFRAIGDRLRSALGDVALRIDHIGSTSIPGLAAKPIIDIQVSVERLEPMTDYLVPLESLGLTWRKDNPEKTKRYFRETPGTRRTHIHVRKLGSWHQQYPLLFRDYLRVHTADQLLYATTKRGLAAKFPNDRHAYTDAKDAIFWEIIRRADAWAWQAGWEPGPSDA